MEETKGELEKAHDETIAAFNLSPEIESEKIDFAVLFVRKGFRLCRLLLDTLLDHPVNKLKVINAFKDLILVANVDSEAKEEDAKVVVVRSKSMTPRKTRSLVTSPPNDPLVFQSFGCTFQVGVLGFVVTNTTFF
uniref:Uncharacterized protein n=1 Tax=Nelumbo nucifera TaxID=4432 RepID=A0A822XHJ2_NELNU|nr:TPA_asm: hypothetical protein HUJ06_021313 [Nelumbo nucifera]